MEGFCQETDFTLDQYGIASKEGKVESDGSHPINWPWPLDGSRQPSRSGVPTTSEHLMAVGEDTING
ncbi:MAG: hypothetical protein IPN60_15880 [Saprospiraceae bacterium]|nr:hypothetical protein [Candidatus Opimibacter skivensis]